VTVRSYRHCNFSKIEFSWCFHVFLLIADFIKSRRTSSAICTYISAEWKINICRPEGFYQQRERIIDFINLYLRLHRFDSILIAFSGTLWREKLRRFDLLLIVVYAVELNNSGSHRGLGIFLIKDHWRVVLEKRRLNSFLRLILLFRLFWQWNNRRYWWLIEKFLLFKRW